MPPLVPGFVPCSHKLARLQMGLSAIKDLTSLGFLGLKLPSSAYLVGSILFGIVGYVALGRA